MLMSTRLVHPEHIHIILCLLLFCVCFQNDNRVRPLARQILGGGCDKLASVLHDQSRHVTNALKIPDLV